MEVVTADPQLVLAVSGRCPRRGAHSFRRTNCLSRNKESGIGYEVSNRRLETSLPKKGMQVSQN
jgi:hypothetical protein